MRFNGVNSKARTTCYFLLMQLCSSGRNIQKFRLDIARSGYDIRCFSRIVNGKDRKDDKILLGRPSNNLKVGIVGLPNVGKSTFFNAITRSAVAAENYPFCTIDPEESRVAVPDARFEWLCNLYKPTTKVPAYLTVIDIAGLVKGASSGAGLGNAFLSHIKAVDAIFHVVSNLTASVFRDICLIFVGTYADEKITHVEGNVHAIRDIEIIHEELRLKDEEFLRKKLEIIARSVRSSESDSNAKLELDVVNRALDVVRSKKDIRHVDWTNKEIEFINPLQLLTAKPVVYLANMNEEEYFDGLNEWLPRISDWIVANSPGDLLIPYSATFEHYLSTLQSFEERKAEEEAFGKSSMLPEIIIAGYRALSLQYYFTAGADEVRAWTIRKGLKAPQAAGVIHTDFERGFIAAEIMKYDDLFELKSEDAVRAAGKYMLKGKEYVMEDADIVFFKFNAAASKK